MDKICYWLGLKLGSDPRLCRILEEEDFKFFLGIEKHFKSAGLDPKGEIQKANEQVKKALPEKRLKKYLLEPDPPILHSRYTDNPNLPVRQMQFHPDFHPQLYPETGPIWGICEGDRGILCFTKEQVDYWVKILETDWVRYLTNGPDSAEPYNASYKRTKGTTFKVIKRFSVRDSKSWYLVSLDPPLPGKVYGHSQDIRQVILYMDSVPIPGYPLDFRTKLYDETKPVPDRIESIQEIGITASVGFKRE